MREKERLNGITQAIIGAAIQVHRVLGPGLLESAYEACLAFELKKRGLSVEQQKPLPLIYEQVKLDCGYRIDLLVEGVVVVEVKSIDALAPIHEAQVMSCLKLSGCKVALLINFNVPLLKDGIRRFVNGAL
ncbi:MAG: GxxExxY protein [Bryobacteraceae bacterium]|jgi:GxxExxY protein